VEFSVNKANALGCRMGCRKPLPAGAPELSAEDRALVIKTCLSGCDERATDVVLAEAARLDVCITDHCEAQCLGSREAPAQTGSGAQK
jgi:hypothetical protein